MDYSHAELRAQTLVLSLERRGANLTRPSEPENNAAPHGCRHDMGQPSV